MLAYLILPLEEQELPLVVMDTDFIGSCNSNYNTITTMTDPLPGIGMISWVNTQTQYLVQMSSNYVINSEACYLDTRFFYYNNTNFFMQMISSITV
jgi:hypothetical protein